MSISSDEINYLIYRYLQENGFTHTAFSFAYESMVTKSSVSQSEIPPGALITFLQKGLEYISIEEHICEDGSVREFEKDYSLLSPFVCDAVALKEDRKPRKISSSSSLRESSEKSVSGMELVNGGGEDVAKNGTNTDGSITNIPATITIRAEGDTKWMQLQGHQGEVFMCVWNPKQLQLASGSADGVCRIWGPWDLSKTLQLDAPNTSISLDPSNEDTPVRTAVLPHNKFVGERFKDVTSVTWSPDGKLLATGCYDGIARIWDDKGNVVKTLEEHTGPVFSLKWNQRGDLILSGSYDKRALVWDATTGSVLKTFALHSAPVLDVDWKDSNTFATCSSDKTIYLCEVTSSDPTTPTHTFTGHTDEVNAICWSPCGRYIASCSDDNTAKIWSTNDEHNLNGMKGLKLDLVGHTKEIYTTRWTPTGQGSINPDLPLRLCTASFDGTVRIWTAEDGICVFTLRRQPQPVYSISPNPSGTMIATGSLGGYVSVFSLEDGSLIREIRGSGDTFDVAWSHDGSKMSCCFSSGALHVVDRQLMVTETTESKSMATSE